LSITLEFNRKNIVYCYKKQTKYIKI